MIIISLLGQDWFANTQYLDQDLNLASPDVKKERELLTMCVLEEDKWGHFDGTTKRIHRKCYILMEMGGTFSAEEQHRDVDGCVKHQLV